MGAGELHGACHRAAEVQRSAARGHTPTAGASNRNCCVCYRVQILTAHMPRLYSVHSVCSTIPDLTVRLTTINPASAAQRDRTLLDGKSSGDTVRSAVPRVYRSLVPLICTVINRLCDCLRRFTACGVWRGRRVVMCWTSSCGGWLSCQTPMRPLDAQAPWTPASLRMGARP